MAFAAHCGVSLDMDGLCFDALASDVDGSEKKPDLLQGRAFEQLIRALFAEELGAVLQIRRDDRSRVMTVLREAGLGACAHFIGSPNAWDEIRVIRNAKPVLCEKRVDLQRAWSETSFRMQSLRDNPECAQQEYDRILDVTDAGLSFSLSFDPADDVAAPYINVGARPQVAILREQGVNGHVEMAAAFDRAGFAAVDVHMSDILAGRVSLADFKGAVACGGFSYGDVLGAGKGWARDDPLQRPRARRVLTLLRSPRRLRAWRLQRLSDDERIERPDSRRRCLAEFRAQPRRAVRGALHHGRNSRIAVAVLCRNGR